MWGADSGLQVLRVCVQFAAHWHRGYLRNRAISRIAIYLAVHVDGILCFAYVSGIWRRSARCERFSASNSPLAQGQGNSKKIYPRSPAPSKVSDRFMLARIAEWLERRAEQRPTGFVFISHLEPHSRGSIAKLDEETRAVQSGIVRSSI